MKIQLIRHATMLAWYGGVKILVDPMLSPAGSMLPVDNSTNQRPNPLVGLPVHEDKLLAVDAVLLTRTHRDHFDDAAARMLPKYIPVFCQPEDGEKLSGLGFSRVQAIGDTCSWKGIRFTRTGGRHGTGEIGEKMGPVSGYVLQTGGEPSLYIAGDTVRCPEVEKALEDHHPQVTVTFAGAARFLTGDPITMTAEDLCMVCRKAPETRVVAVHLEAFNHCLLTRRELRGFLEKEQLLEQVHIPMDGELLEFIKTHVSPLFLSKAWALWWNPFSEEAI